MRAPQSQFYDYLSSALLRTAAFVLWEMVRYLDGDGFAYSDCLGEWGECNADGNRVWTEISPLKGRGKPCPLPLPCCNSPIGELTCPQRRPCGCYELELRKVGRGDLDCSVDAEDREAPGGYPRESCPASALERKQVDCEDPMAVYYQRSGRVCRPGDAACQSMPATADVPLRIRCSGSLAPHVAIVMLAAAVWGTTLV